MNDPEDPPKSEPPKAAWSPVAAVLYTIGLFFVTQIIMGIAIGLYARLAYGDTSQAAEWLSSSIMVQFLYILLTEIMVVCGVLLFLKHRGMGLRFLGLTRPRFLTDPLIAVGGFVLYFVLYIVLAAVVTTLVPSIDLDQRQDVGFQAANGLLPLAVVFLSLVVLPPIAEEILLRGFLFGSLRARISFVWAAIWTSIIFAIAHLQGGEQGAPLLWIAAIDTFVLSLVLCYLREKTGRLWAPIGLHMLKNGVAYVALFILHSS